jgi:YHS domain-containing protein
MRALLLLAILGLAVVVLWPMLRGMRPRFPTMEPSRRDELVKDPVCQTYVVLSRAVRREIGGTLTYFCSAECAERYLRNGRRA